MSQTSMNRSSRSLVRLKQPDSVREWFADMLRLWTQETATIAFKRGRRSAPMTNLRNNKIGY